MLSSVLGLLPQVDGDEKLLFLTPGVDLAEWISLSGYHCPLFTLFCACFFDSALLCLGVGGGSQLSSCTLFDHCVILFFYAYRVQ